MKSSSTHQTLHWSECAGALGKLAAECDMPLDAQGRSFESPFLRVLPPLVFPIAGRCRSLSEYVASLPNEPGKHLLVLLQAGAASIGYFEGGEVVSTKSFKRYVVRGNGKAQPTHLMGKGKSRYGSRLRLQNAKRLLVETNEKLLDWNAEFGTPDQIYYSCPIRLWPSLFETKPAPPFAKDDPLIRIPLDMPKPNSEVLLRTYRSLCYARLESLAPPPATKKRQDS